MSKNKGYNSILFLTTLSVYLGLVLVGAPPSLLAQQAALTQRFEIQNEFESEEDPDKDPGKSDDLAEDIEIIKNLDIAGAIREFLSDLRKLESIGKFNPRTDWDFSYDLQRKNFGQSISVNQSEWIENPWLQTALDRLISNARADSEHIDSVSANLPNCDGENCQEVRVTIESDAENFTFSLTFKKKTAENAKVAAEAFSQVFLAKKVALTDHGNLLIYENTRISSENDQVFIITRLPRGSLDALVKSEN